MATTISKKRLDKNKQVLSETLMERKSTHGDFSNTALTSQLLKQVTKNGVSYNLLSDVQKEALDMILHKISRIVDGDPNHKDSWHDIAGYAKLVEDRII